jgi:hypothetical protein
MSNIDHCEGMVAQFRRAVRFGAIRVVLTVGRPLPVCPNNGRYQSGLVGPFRANKRYHLK